MYVYKNLGWLLVIAILSNACTSTNKAVKCPSFSKKKVESYAVKNNKKHKVQSKRTQKVVHITPSNFEKEEVTTIRKELIKFSIKPIKPQSISKIANSVIQKNELRSHNFRKIPKFYTEKIPPKKLKGKKKRQNKKRKKADKIYKAEEQFTYNNKARIGGILGIVSLSVMVVPFTYFFSLPLAIAALILTTKRRANNDRPRLVRTGFIMSIITIVFWGIALIGLAMFVAVLTTSI